MLEIENFRFEESRFAEAVIKEVFEEDFYDSLGKQRYQTVVDLGAGPGVFSIFISKHAEKVLAVEPQKENLEILKGNILVNKAENVKIVPYAISTKNGTSKLFLCEENPTMHSLVYDFGNSSLEVKTLTLPTLISRYRLKEIDLLALDVEGTEFELFKDEKFLSTLRNKVRNITGELHKFFEREPGIEKLLEELQDIFNLEVRQIGAKGELYSVLFKGRRRT